MKEENKKFYLWYNSLQPYEKTYFANKIMEKCEVSRTTVFLWTSGDRKIKRPYKAIINELAGIELFDVKETSPIMQMN